MTIPAHSTIDGGLPEPHDIATSQPAASTTKAGRRHLVRKVAVAALGLVLPWLVVRHTLVAYLGQGAPEAALWLAPDDPVALVGAIEKALLKQPAQPETSSKAAPAARLAPDRTPAKLDEPSAAEPTNAALLGIPTTVSHEELRSSRDLMMRGLAREPISSQALATVAWLTYVLGDEERAGPLLDAAGQRSKRQAFVNLVGLSHSLRQNDLRTAFHHADMLMRTQPGLIREIAPALGRLAELDGGIELLVELLAANPNWTDRYFTNLLNGITDPLTPLRLIKAQQAVGQAPKPVEVAYYLDLLISKQFHDEAYYAWLQLLPAGQLSQVDSIFNGDFEQPLSGTPFDWHIGPSVGASVEVVRHPEAAAGRALRIDFDGERVQLGEIRQRVQLPPGQYRLSWRMQGGISGRRGLKWLFSCAHPNGRRLAESAPALGNQAEWRSLEARIEVPADCSSQVLRLVHDARYSAEQFASGTVWIDDIAISRLAAVGE